MKRLIVLLLVVGSACGDAASVAPGATSTGSAAPPPVAVSTAAPATSEPFSCEVTIPDGSFVPPEPWPAEASVGVWYGTDDLWTVLSTDGVYLKTKGVWWSVNFPGGQFEEQPDISVVARRLDAPGEMRTEHIGTNAFTTQDGWFMINGLDPEAEGCWELTATYKGASLTYTYQVS